MQDICQGEKTAVRYSDVGSGVVLVWWGYVVLVKVIGVDMVGSDGGRNF